MVRTFITKLYNCIIELKCKFELTHSDRTAAQRLQQRLMDMDGEFKDYHLAVMDLLEEEEDLENVQATLDHHDDRVTALFDLLMSVNTQVEHEVKVNKSRPQAAFVQETAPCRTDPVKIAYCSFNYCC